MTDVILLSPMTRDEAQSCINSIRHHLAEARQHALDLREREGWKALGYASLRDCFEGELGSSWQHGYRLVAAAEVDANLSEYSPIGEKLTIPEFHARHLSKLPPAKQIVAYDRAQTLATAEGAKQVAGRHVEAAVAQVQAEISIHNSPVIAHAVAAGEITPADGVQIKRELDRLPPQHQANVLSLMTEHGLRDAALVVPLAEMSTRPVERASKAFAEIQRTGHVAGVPLAQATLTDLNKLRDEAQREHISEALEEKRQKAYQTGQPVVEPKIITVYTNAPQRTLAALRQALSDDDLAALARLLMERIG